MDLKEALKRKKFIVTSEVQAPIDEEPEEFVQNLNKIRGRVDGISVSEAALDGIVGDNIKTCEILQTNRFQAIYQTTTTRRVSKTSLFLRKTTGLPVTASRK